MLGHLSSLSDLMQSQMSARRHHLMRRIWNIHFFLRGEKWIFQLWTSWLWTFPPGYIIILDCLDPSFMLRLWFFTPSIYSLDTWLTLANMSRSNMCLFGWSCEQPWCAFSQCTESGTVQIRVSKIQGQKADMDHISSTSKVSINLNRVFLLID